MLLRAVMPENEQPILQNEYLFYYTEQNTIHKRGTTEILDKYSFYALLN